MTSARRRRGWFWLLPLLLAVSGCGPGVGGTGTGEGFALEYFGAKRASVCSASFASELKCPSRIVVGPEPVGSSDGSELVVWVDDPAVAQVIVRISDSDVDLEVLCEDLRFSGTWGETNEGVRRFFGHYTTRELAAAVPATLTVQSAEGGGLSYVLKDAAERTVAGPLVLQRTEHEVIRSSCSSVSNLPLRGARYR
jgi:hypothetical protein